MTYVKHILNWADPGSQMMDMTQNYSLSLHKGNFPEKTKNNRSTWICLKYNLSTSLLSTLMTYIWSCFQMHRRYIRRIRTQDPMISRRLSPLDYRTVAAEATENLLYLCTVAGPDPDPDPNPRGGGQLPNPKSAILR